MSKKLVNIEARRVIARAIERYSPEQMVPIRCDVLHSLLAESVPAGWKLVPVEPTADMLDAGLGAKRGADEQDHIFGVYLAMLAAAADSGQG